MVLDFRGSGGDEAVDNSVDVGTPSLPSVGEFLGFFLFFDFFLCVFFCKISCFAEWSEKSGSQDSGTSSSMNLSSSLSCFSSSGGVSLVSDSSKLPRVALSSRSEALVPCWLEPFKLKIAGTAGGAQSEKPIEADGTHGNRFFVNTHWAIPVDDLYGLLPLL